MTDASADPAPAPEDQRIEPGRAKRAVWPWVLLGIVLSFTLGVIGSPWLEMQVRSHLPEGFAVAPLHGQDKRVEGLRIRIEELESGLEKIRQQDGMRTRNETELAPSDLIERLRQVEIELETQRATDENAEAGMRRLMAELQQLQGQSVHGDARMQDLFILSVLRRMVETGRPVGAVASALSHRFRSRDAGAVDAILSWSDQPQTRRTLLARIPDLKTGMPASQETPSGGWWQQLRASLGGLVREHDPLASGTEQRVDNFQLASTALQNGDLGYAIANLEQERRSADVRQWLADARLLEAAEMALDRLEGVALADAARVAAEIPRIVE